MSFRLYALNFNGVSEASDIDTFNVCTEPKGMPPPYKVSSVSNQLLLAWSEPLENGGCPISGFAIYRDDSYGSAVDTEVNADNDASIRDNPILRQASVTHFPPDTVGRYFRYKVEVFNREGSSDSSYVTLLNAGPPLPPTAAPVLNEQTDTYLKVSLPLVAASNNGGSDLISYNL